MNFASRRRFSGEGGRKEATDVKCSKIGAYHSSLGSGNCSYLLDTSYLSSYLWERRLREIKI